MLFSQLPIPSGLNSTVQLLARRQRTDSGHTAWLLGVLLLAATWLAAPRPAAAAEPAPPEKIYRFGAFPMIAVGQIDKIFAPVAAEFTRVLGHPVHFRTKPTFAEFRQELSRETYDIAVIQPFDYVLAHDNYNYLPLARFEKPLSAVFMVLADSPLKDLHELRGAKVAVPPVTAAVVQMGKKGLLDAGFDFRRDLTLQYTRSHDSCLQLVMVKSAAACVSSRRAVHVFEEKWGKHFRQLHETAAIPNTLFVVHRRVPTEVRELLLKTITSWPETSEVGAEFIKLNNNQRLIPAANSEYDVVRTFPKNLDE